MIWGGVGTGKTTLLKALRDEATPSVLKTQMVEYSGAAIDTPGEFSEMTRLRFHLQAMCSDADLFLVVHDATRQFTNFPPLYFNMFRQPSFGVATKMDAPEADAEQANAILRQIGVSGDIFLVSAVTGMGISELRQAILKERGRVEDDESRRGFRPD